MNTGEVKIIELTVFIVAFVVELDKVSTNVRPALTFFWSKIS